MVCTGRGWGVFRKWAGRGTGSAYRAESAGGFDEASGLDDGVDPTEQLHLTVHTPNRPFLGRDDGHLHLAVVDQRVEDRLDVLHGQIHLTGSRRFNIAAYP